MSLNAIHFGMDNRWSQNNIFEAYYLIYVIFLNNY